MGLFDFVGDIFSGGGSETQIVPQSSIRPSQSGFLDALLGQLQGEIGQPGQIAPRFLAPSGPGQLQQQAFGLPGFGQAQQAFGQSLGFDPAQIAQQFEPTAQAARQGFQDQTIPAIQGALGAQGAARSSGSADILGRAGQRLEQGLAAQLGQQQFGAQQAAQQRGFQAPGQALNFASQIANLGQQQRGIGEQQRAFDLQRFQQRDPFRNPALNLGLQASGFQTFQQPGIIPGQAGFGQSLLPLAGSAIGAAGQVGGFGNLFSGLGGLFN